ncbi:MAG: hypothetical protein AAF226_12730, partial [Verrucomicrobiota bacterium]
EETKKEVEPVKPSPREETPKQSGGLGALVESGGEPKAPSKGGSGALVEANSSLIKKPEPITDAPKLERNSEVRWDSYDGDLNLCDGYLPGASGRSSAMGERLSAFTIALIVHVAIAALISLIIVAVPRPKPPQLIATLPVDSKRELVVTRITKPEQVTPSAASAQAVDVLTTLAISDFALPEVENTDNFKVTALTSGQSDFGAGMSLHLDKVEDSDVNFFGISGGGKRIVFVVDATEHMLVDEKGGMFAYDKVKDEIGAMLSGLNRGTLFNILLYDGRQVNAFRPEPVRGLPSNLRMAIEWLDPVNRNYGDLGLDPEWGVPIDLQDHESYSIRANDMSHYGKSIQKAMEWGAASVFCIVSRAQSTQRSPSEEELEKMRQNPGTPGKRGEVSKADAERWRKAQEETRQWLAKENAARAEKGLSPKVVINFTQLVQEVTGETRPRAQGGTQGTPGYQPKVEPVETDDLIDHFRRVVKINYEPEGLDEPSVHMVVFIGEDQRMDDDDKDHFSDLARKNRGKLKILKGLVGLADVTSK